MKYDSCIQKGSVADGKGKPQTRSRPAWSASEAEILSTVGGGVVFVPAIGLVTGTERLISFDWITAVMKGGVLDQGWQQLRTVELLWLVSKHLLKGGKGMEVRGMLEKFGRGIRGTGKNYYRTVKHSWNRKCEGLRSNRS
ncbi:hypothetical protein TNIN_329971 [Trichonephila inaurata madagascariensis]|uniref:Uncharacterized protein n=1 Tax=Trichonephila inaurata madagascariensis TaxID=2747483 RepID=A0A8X7BN77_9ARAC|nr:hypothetical protein TNIN_329971 [Trichonephila inaurata madagascariensis]